MGIKSAWTFWVISLLMMPIGVTVAKSATINVEDKHLTAGWLEYVVLEPWQIKLRAKLDTGAKTSSLHALDLQRFERDGQPWVRFSTEGKQNEITTKPIELPIKRDVKIKSHHHDPAVRPVVELSFCLNGHIYHGEFSLVDRSQFNYAVLLGRRILKQGIIVDSSTTFTLPIEQQRCERLLDNIRQ